MAAITSGVFFRRRPSSTLPAYPLAIHVPGEKLRSSPGYGTRIEAQELGDASVPAVAELHRFEARIQPSLAFIQQRDEQYDGCLQLVRHNAQACTEGRTVKAHPLREVNASSSSGCLAADRDR